MKTKTLGELATILGGRIVGDDGAVIRGVAPLESAGEGDLSFLANPKYSAKVAESEASAILVKEPVDGARQALVVVDDPYFSLSRVLPLFYDPEPDRPEGVDEAARIDPDAFVDPSAAVGPFAVVRAGARIGPRTVLYSGTYVGRDVTIGADCSLYPNVVVRHGTVIGDRVTLHAGVVIGGDGFGYAFHEGAFRKVPQVGIVRIEDDVEVGANSTIDRGSLGETRIGRGVKIDNLVQIAHNCTVGEHTALAAQVGVAGSTTIGRYVQLAGQAGVAGHIAIGDRTIIGAQAGVVGNVPDNQFWSGMPARPHRQTMRGQGELLKLSKLRDTVRALAREVAELRERLPEGRSP